jgi:hypothetical protein
MRDHPLPFLAAGRICCERECEFCHGQSSCFRKFMAPTPSWSSIPRLTLLKNMDSGNRRAACILFATALAGELLAANVVKTVTSTQPSCCAVAGIRINRKSRYTPYPVSPITKANARLSRAISALPRAPILRPIRLRRTVTGLSAITCDRIRKPFSMLGSIVTRKSGASTMSDVI